MYVQLTTQPNIQDVLVLHIYYSKGTTDETYQKRVSWISNDSAHPVTVYGPLKTIEQPPTYPEQDASNSETSSSCDGWCVWGIISITIIVIFTIIAVFILAHYYGYVYIRFYDHNHKQKNSKNSGDQPSGNLTEEKFPTINKPSESACVRQSEDNHGVSMDE
ncbi:hypothetical protein PoB_007231000 [Plakobranchus ocellatus]|uniref:Uncharacterized protein n=1 Tax=Plakobranchus ocellatus TaxID=259542 RepID=A0AAV4DNT2_9GAST|nr:hypothetical protein PoB_007231000 [Plakobranchus ocellatus]